MDEEKSKLSTEAAEKGVEIPLESLSTEVLTAIIEEFILREGTDYGVREAGLDRKIDDVRRQLQSGEASVRFDLETETATISVNANPARLR